jgi:hypothetical protein
MYVTVTLTLAQSNCKHKIMQPQIINTSLLIWIGKGDSSCLICPSQVNLDVVVVLQYTRMYLALLHSLYCSSMSAKENEKFESTHTEDGYSFEATFNNIKGLRFL